VNIDDFYQVNEPEDYYLYCWSIGWVQTGRFSDTSL